MATAFETTYNIILPIFLVVAVSALVDRIFAPDLNGLSRLVIYLFTPCLVLQGIANTALGADEAGQLVVMALVSSLLVALVGWAVARAAHLDGKLESSFVLATVLINAGNYGIPLSRFAFGVEGEERALIFFVVTVVISNTLGVYLASRGEASARRALRNVFLVPLPYAALLGLILNVGHMRLPLPVDRAVALMSQAAIPGMLVVLGIQLSRTSIRGRIAPILQATGVRLVAAPAIAFALAVLLGLTGVTRQVSIVQASMPTAVISGVLTTEFGGDSEFVTAVILVSTLASVLTLSVLLSVLL